MFPFGIIDWHDFPSCLFVLNSFVTDNTNRGSSSTVIFGQKTCLTLPVLSFFRPKHKDASIFENLSNPVMLTECIILGHWYGGPDEQHSECGEREWEEPAVWQPCQRVLERGAGALRRRAGLSGGRSASERVEWREIDSHATENSCRVTF